MNSYTKNRQVFIVAIISTFSLQAFSQVQDAAFWPGLKLSHNFTEKYKTTVFIQERMEDNMQKHRNLFVDACFSYQILDNLDIESAYVYVNHVTAKERYSNQHQLYFDLNWRIKLTKRLKIRYTPIYQIQWHDINSSATGKIPDYYWRNKVGLEYRLKKRIQPFAFVELRTNLNHQEYYFNRTRYCIGSTFKFHHNFDVDLYYMLQRGYNDEIPNDTYIIGLNLKKDI